jgi:molybdopterin converting factor small subunit
MSVVTLRILIFGPLAKAAAARELTADIAAGALCGHAVRNALIQTYPAFKALIIQARLAVNHTFVSDDTAVCIDDEIALISPVNGG